LWRTIRNGNLLLQERTPIKRHGQMDFRNVLSQKGLLAIMATASALLSGPFKLNIVRLEDR
jgi:hypothetical protein